MKLPFRVGLTYNLKHPGADLEAEAEYDNQETIDALRQAIETRYPCIPIEANEHCFERLRTERPDLVVQVAAGSGGPAREGYVPSMLEFLGIPYTGSDPTTLNICLHKARAKEILAYHGLPTAPWQVARGKIGPLPFPFPAVVKPLHEGSSKGLRSGGFVHTQGELEAAVAQIQQTLDQPALVEQYLPGREFTAALLGNGPDRQVLPIIELRFDSLPPGVPPLYSFEAKWIWDTSDRPLEIFECPARLDEGLRRRIERLCLSACEVLEVRDWCRIDVRLDAEGVPHIIELNPLPGTLPKPEDNSCFPKAARTAGMSYSDLITRLIEIAAKRHNLSGALPSR